MHSLTQRSRTVEGGAGQAQTVCAPQDGRCGQIAGDGPQSEQDFQKHAHNGLKTELDGRGTQHPKGVFTFSFKTVWRDDVLAEATIVHYHGEDAEFFKPYGKRSLGPTHLVTEKYHSNGTTQIVTRRLKDEEVRHFHDESLLFLTSSQKFSVWKRKASNSTISGNATTPVTPPMAQHFDALPAAPPLAIMDISKIFMHEQALHASISASNLTANRTMGAAKPTARLNTHARRAVHGQSPVHTGLLRSRQNGGQCSADSPCPDGSCCNNEGNCGYGPVACGSDVCVNNCMLPFRRTTSHARDANP